MDYSNKVSQDQAKNLGIDFDGVIHDDYLGFHDGTIYGKPIEGSLAAIKFLTNHFNIIIFTAKAKKDRPLINGKTGVQLVGEWLKKHNILKYVSEITAEKPRAMLYVDDKGFRFDNWTNTLKFIKSLSEI
tara:strand:+ start:366 stop:755 length:390 start_codon:yes stop_codon:yes gene_type:complete